MITISIGKDEKIETIKLNASRTLSGDIMIFDHEDVDIVLVPSKNKCIAFPKDEIDDKSYGAQDRLFNILGSRGVIDLSTVRGGSFYGAMEATILESAFEGIDEIQATLYAIHRFIEEERPYFEATSRISDKDKEHLLDPDSEYNTELGDVPHSTSKGSMDPQVRPYGFMYNYSLIREDDG